MAALRLIYYKKKQTNQHCSVATPRRCQQPVAGSFPFCSATLLALIHHNTALFQASLSVAAAFLCCADGSSSDVFFFFVGFLAQLQDTQGFEV